MKPVVHFEIPAEDYERAKKFYSDLFEWKIDEWPGSPNKYGMATTTQTGSNGPEKPGAINGAIMQRGSESDTTVVTIEVPSIDEYLEKITQAGGRVKMAKMKVGEMGYNATFYDTENNVVGLWELIKQS